MTMVLDFFNQTLAVTEMELRKLVRDPTELLSRIVQPILWLVIFGQVLSRVRGIPTGSIDYLSFMAPGVLAQSILFSAIFYGIAVIWEKDLGMVHKLMVSPAYRVSIVTGKAITAGFRGLIQALFIYALTMFLGVHVRITVGPVLGVFASIMVGAAIFSTFSLIVACIVKTRERFMGIGQLLTMPLFFASNAIYPVSLMPGWLQVVAHINPLTYLVDAIRALMITGGETLYGVGFDLLILGTIFLVLLVVASRLYPSLAR